MNIKERKLLAHFLEMASDEFGNHGCNDVDESVWKDWTIEERRQLVKEFHENNGDPEDYNEDFLHLPDYCIMDLLSDKLTDKKEIRKEKLIQLQLNNGLNSDGLKPCPFCGEIKHIEIVRTGTNRRSCQVSCMNCGCFLESNEIGYGDAWNRRKDA